MVGCEAARLPQQHAIVGVVVPVIEEAGAGDRLLDVVAWLNPSCRARRSSWSVRESLPPSPARPWIGQVWSGNTIDMRIGSVLLVIWLLIGVAAAFQRDYFKGSDVSCAKASTIAVTVIAGPLNYVGVNPKLQCPNVKTPQPSK